LFQWLKEGTFLIETVAMNYAKKIYRWFGKQFRRIDSNVYTILFFTGIICLVIINNMTNERRSTLLSIVQNDLEESNKSKELYHKLIGLIRGDAQKVKTSLFSFRQIQYSLNNRDFFIKSRNGDFQNNITTSSSSNDENCYFVVKNNLITLNKRSPFKPIVGQLKDDLFKKGALMDYEKKIFLYWNYSRESDLQNVLKRARPDSSIELYKDIDFKSHFVTVDSLLYQVVRKNDLSVQVSGDNLIIIPLKQNTFYVTSIYKEKSETDDYPTRRMHIDSVDEVQKVVYLAEGFQFFIRGIKNKKEKNYLFSTFDSIYTPVARARYVPFINDVDHLIMDNGRNIIFPNKNPKPDTLFRHSINRKYIDEDTTTDWLALRFGKQSATFCFIASGEVQQSNFYTLTRIFKGNKDSVNIEKLCGVSASKGFSMLSDLILCDSSGTSSIAAHFFKPEETGFDDSTLFKLVADKLVMTPRYNEYGLMLLNLNDYGDFVVLEREGRNEIKAGFTPDTWNISHMDFDYSVSYDTYYIVIFVCAVIVVYFFGLTLLDQFRTRKLFEAWELPQLNATALDYKLNLTFSTMEALRKRSETMLRLGIMFGIAGVLISAIMFKVSNLDLGTSWQDPHTLLNVLKPIIILLFMETFTFYFLKQYRIIFNEYKLFYSIFIDLLAANSLIELDTIPCLDKKTLQLLQAKMSTPRYQMYERDTKEKIDEFAHPSILEIIKGIKETNPGN